MSSSDCKIGHVMICLGIPWNSAISWNDILSSHHIMMCPIKIDPMRGKRLSIFLSKRFATSLYGQMTLDIVCHITQACTCLLRGLSSGKLKGKIVVNETNYLFIIIKYFYIMPLPALFLLLFFYYCYYYFF